MQKLMINQLSKCFGDVQALQDISLTLDEGKMLAVLGPSGCGKTTLLRAIAGFETPDVGRIAINGNTVFDAQTNTKHICVKPERRNIGYVPQHGVLFPHLTVAKNISFGLSQLQKANQTARVNEMLDLVGMTGLGHRMPFELSGGQQQRIALARALAPSPSLVLLDEPFSALDAGLRISLREEVKSTLEHIGATAIMVTHDQEEALSMADLVAVMRHGHCVQVSDPVSLYKYPVDLQVAQFVGEAVVLPARLINGQLHSRLGTHTLAQACKTNRPETRIMIRPEQFVLCNGDDAQFNACVLNTIYYGHDVLVQLSVQDPSGTQQIKMRVSGARAFRPGEYLDLRVNGEVMAYQ
ncbi:ABC transporter ATP-binding protein [Oceanisphaera sp. W20_SRM_FM3]|uniref:ABC transporter ATP-binding protein n=1 Tax=Oceanisphaera sp. W20_SRM_FM3 TaxID=3240267 RepID=UPI003F96E0A5